MAAKSKTKPMQNLKVSFPKTRYQVRKDKRIEFCAAEVDIYITEKGKKRSEKDFKIYKVTEIFNDKLMRFHSESEVVEDGFATIEDAIKRADELAAL